MLILALVACQSPSVGRSGEVVVGLPDYELDTALADSGPARHTGVDDDDGETRPDPEAPALLINEVVARNESTWPGDNAAWPDWVELYNASDVSIALSDVALRDPSDLPWLGGEGTIEPGERLVVAIDDSLAGGLHAPFQLDGDGGERLVLSVAGLVSDRLSLGEMRTDVAWARIPDGGNWAITTDTSPDAANPESASLSLDLSARVFQLDELTYLNLRLTDAAIQALRVSRLSWVDGELDVPEGDWGDIRTRLKAYVGSARSIDQKCAWKIDLNDISGREWRGVRGLTVNNMVQDNTYVHEFAAYELYRALDVPAPRVGYAWMTLNDADYGLYLLIESIDEAFLERWFGDTSGNLYEGAYGVDLYTGYLGSFDLESGSDTSRSDLSEVISILDGGASEDAYAEVSKVFDMERFLSLMAVEALSYHWDGYSTANNYRLYKDPRTDLFTMIPWGSDQTFITAYFTPWTGRGRLFQWCLTIDSCSARYDEILLDASYTMDALDLGTQIQDLEDWLYPYIEADPRKEFAVSTHTYYLDYTVTNMAGIPASVRAQLAAR